MTAKVVFSVEVPLDGTEAEIKFRFTLPEDPAEREKLINKTGAVLAGLMSGNLDQQVFENLHKSKNPAAQKVLQGAMFYKEVLRLMERSTEPVICPTAFGRVRRDEE